MKESKFIRVGPSHQLEHPTPGTAGLRQAEEMFFSTGHLTSADIRTMASLIAKDIRAALIDQPRAAEMTFSNFLKYIFTKVKPAVPKVTHSAESQVAAAQPTVLIQAFEPTSMNLTDQVEKFGFSADPEDTQKFIGPNGMVITSADLYGELNRIKRAVAEELHKQLPDVNFHMRVTPMSPRVETLHSNRVLKSVGETSKTFTEANARALEALYALPERSPHLMYPVVEHSKSWQTQIHNRLDFTNMLEYSTRRPLPPLPKVIQYFSDAYRGLDFLYTHNFELSDLEARNVGIDETNGKGVLFDYDYLYKRDESSERKVTEQSAVAELATTLGKVLKIYRENQPRLAEFDDIQGIVDRLKSQDKKHLPTIKEVINLLDKI